MFHTIKAPFGEVVEKYLAYASGEGGKRSRQTLIIRRSSSRRQCARSRWCMFPREASWPSTRTTRTFRRFSGNRCS